jgi:hypothetical protein
MKRKKNRLVPSRMKFVMVMPTQWDGVIIAILDAHPTLMTDDPEMVCIGYGVLTNATAVALDLGHVFLAAITLRIRQSPSPSIHQ